MFELMRWRYYGCLARYPCSSHSGSEAKSLKPDLLLTDTPRVRKKLKG